MLTRTPPFGVVFGKVLYLTITEVYEVFLSATCRTRFNAYISFSKIVPGTYKKNEYIRVERQRPRDNFTCHGAFFI